MILGVSAGLSPGPLLTLVISHTLAHGAREGVKVALAPLITDLPIILISMAILAQLTNAHAILGLISIAGGFFVLYLGCENLRSGMPHSNPGRAQPQSLSRGVLVNVLSPHPYLFWLTVGAPIMIKAWAKNLPAAAAFVVGFYACLVGSKVSIAILIGQSRQLLIGNIYRYVMRILGVLLLAFGLLLLRNGWSLLGF
ncbi:MAG: LysE family transporter [Candidatus Aureabacteria bacterium]|nr:LysE family transporter [Candidatus Auribacterota bacterium]